MQAIENMLKTFYCQKFKRQFIYSQQYNENINYAKKLCEARIAEAFFSHELYRSRQPVYNEVLYGHSEWLYTLLT